MENDKPIKVEFAPGAFDHFDGTQEELDELMAEIHRLAESGELFENAKQISIDDLDEEEDAEIIEFLQKIPDEDKRKLQ